MRLVKVKGPSGSGNAIMQTAFSVGVESVSFHNVTKHSPDGTPVAMDVVDIETSTPKANSFVDKLLSEPYFDRSQFSFNAREPRSIVSSVDSSSLTIPLHVPHTDILEELWQFSHITYGLVGRVFVASCLLAYGLIQQQILLMIAGLFFLPMLPILMSVSLGGLNRDWRLCLHGIGALAACTVTLFVGGIAVGALSSPPIRYDEFPSIPISILITAGVGIAAGLAAIDDVGRRELIGLAAASQVGIIPVWLGVTFIFGAVHDMATAHVPYRIATFGVNTLMLLLGSAAVYWLTGLAGPGVRSIEEPPDSEK